MQHFPQKRNCQNNAELLNILHFCEIPSEQVILEKIKYILYCFFIQLQGANYFPDQNPGLFHFITIKKCPENFSGHLVLFNCPAEIYRSFLF